MAGGHGRIVGASWTRASHVLIERYMETFGDADADASGLLAILASGEG